MPKRPRTTQVRKRRQIGTTAAPKAPKKVTGGRVRSATSSTKVHTP